MFKQFTQLPDRQPIFLRESRVQAFAATEDGTRIFLTSSFSCLVEEDADTVREAFLGRIDQYDQPD